MKRMQELRIKLIGEVRLQKLGKSTELQERALVVISCVPTSVDFAVSHYGTGAYMLESGFPDNQSCCVRHLKKRMCAILQNLWWKGHLLFKGSVILTL